MTSMKKNNILKFLSSGFTIMEILIVMAVIVILSGITLGANIKSVYEKSRDSKRKQDLSKLSRILEDYYNDHQNYPRQNYPSDGQIFDSPWGSAFTINAPSLPHDPLYPNQEYFYQTGPDIQNFYVIYTKLEDANDPDIVRVGCQNGCGPLNLLTGKRDFNYFVSSTDILMLAGIPNNGADPGTYFGGGGSPTGGGGGGGGVPTPTSLYTPTVTPPWGSGPSPTFNPTPPPSDTLCNHNQCCLANWCGAWSYPEGGAYCTNRQQCSFVFQYTWTCEGNGGCP